MQYRLILVCSLSALLICGWSLRPAYPDASSNPILSSKTSREVQNKMQEATRQFLQAQCKILEAMKSYTEQSNESIQAASKDLSSAAADFQNVVKMIGADDEKLSISSDGDSANAVNALIQLGYKAPETYGLAVTILSEVSQKAAKTLSGLRYNEKAVSNLEVLKALKNASAEAVEAFVAVSTLTTLAKG